MNFKVGDRVSIKDYNPGGMGTIFNPRNSSPGVNHYPVRLDNYKYGVADDHHWIHIKHIVLTNSNLYNCPICKNDKCNTSECG